MIGGADPALSSSPADERMLLPLCGAKGLRRLGNVAFWRTILQFWVPMVAASAASGMLYSEVVHNNAVRGAVYGGVIGVVVMAFERGLVLRPVNDWTRRLPLLLSVPVSEIAYVICILIGNLIAGTVLWATQNGRAPYVDFVRLDGGTLLYALAVSAFLVSVVRVRDLIGTEVLASLLIGRYHHPVQEERIFLFIDLVGSTAYAQQNGDLKAQEFLGAIFAALAEPVRRNQGSIDDYVGDMALITWPMARGVRQGRCVACIFDFFEAIERDARDWRERFGQVPRFRAALHGGTVVTAEVGVDRHKIAYFGDVVNTTGRLEALCRTLDAPVLISSDLLSRLDGVPLQVAVRPLGTHAVKGRGQDLTVMQLEAA